MPVTDPYRWLEDQESPRTREWLSAQTRYARSYLDSIPDREQIRERIRQLLDVETYDSLQKVGARYFFRKRVAGQEQPCICLRDGRDGSDEVLVDPALRGTGPHTAVKPLRISPDGRLLLYEVKQGGERAGNFELLDIEKRRDSARCTSTRLSARLRVCARFSSLLLRSRGPGSREQSNHRAAYKHILGTSFADDKEVFFAGDEEEGATPHRPGAECLGFLVVRFEESTLTRLLSLVVGRHRKLRNP